MPQPRAQTLQLARTTVYLVVLCTLAACADEEGPNVVSVSPEICDSRLKWVGNEESATMKPGSNCIRCHTSSDGPDFLFAGTVYSSLDAEDDCFGVEGATVVVADEAGTSVQMRTNAAGNFFLEREDAPNLTPPYTTSVRYEGREIQMSEPLFSPNCVDCHDGSSGGRIPPRIVIPPSP